MYNNNEESLVPQPRPRKAPLDRRVWAFLLDFILVWLFSSLSENLLIELLIFVSLWFILRVIIVYTNKGQSLGRWAFDLKITQQNDNRLPELLTLAKREGIICIAAFLGMIGLKINFRDFLLMALLAVPLLIDLFTALTDDEYNRSFHDRFTNTVIIQTKRGFSLDLRLKKWSKEAKKAWQKNRQNKSKYRDYQE